MKPKHMALLIAPLLVALVAAACGGDGGDGDGAGIRTSKGLAVAALGTNALAGEGAASAVDDLISAVAKPDRMADAAIDPGGVMAPEIAPFPVSSSQESQTGVTVQGYGSATADADSAVLALYFNHDMSRVEPPVPGEPEPDFEDPYSDEGISMDAPRLGDPGTRSFRAEELTEADLQPIVDAIVAQGISPDDVEVTVEPFYGDSYYDDSYYGASATITVSLRDVAALEGIVDAVTDAASSLEEISFDGPSVSYTVSDCAALEMAAMEAAVEDARERGDTFAGALGVDLGAVVGASHYAYSPFGSPCDWGSDGSYLVQRLPYAAGESPEVQLIATVTITFAIQ
jgi:uncharacterized protein YggE